MLLVTRGFRYEFPIAQIETFRSVSVKFDREPQRVTP